MEISERHTEWAVISRLKRMLGAPPQIPRVELIVPTSAVYESQ
jgi:hypothetical protein